MKHTASVFMLAILALSVLCLPVQAAREVEVRSLSGVDPQNIYVGREPSEQCVVGNSYANWAISGWAIPPEEYALVFEPLATCSVCPVGFDINTIHVVVQVEAACDIYMSVDVEEAAGPDTCLSPGPELCRSDDYEVNLSSAGVYDIGLPIDCPCLWSGWTYLLSFHFDAIYPESAEIQIVTNDYPTVCTSWNDWGSGWYDLVADAGFPGNLTIYADAECCETSGAEPTSWGMTKRLFR
jgi:hypothetical protein